LVEETTDGFPVLKLNAASWQVLRKQLPVQIAVPEKLKDSRAESAETSAEAAGLLAQLRSLRKQLADQQGIPPYIVFTESTLRDMAQRMPRSLAQFGQVSGVGSRKLAQYGDVFVEAINAYCEDRGVQPSPVRAQRDRPPVVSNTRAETLRLYQAGHSLDAIAQLRSLRRTTVIGHIAALLAAGEAVNLDDFVAPERQTAIRKAIETTASPYLNAVRDRLGEDYAYDEIRLVQSALRAEQAPT